MYYDESRVKLTGIIPDFSERDYTYGGYAGCAARNALEGVKDVGESLIHFIASLGTGAFKITKGALRAVGNTIIRDMEGAKDGLRDIGEGVVDLGKEAVFEGIGGAMVGAVKTAVSTLAIAPAAVAELAFIPAKWYE